MVVEVIDHWLPEEMEAELEELCRDLGAFGGYRTVWLDRDGHLWHAEPEEPLPAGAKYLGTFMRPSRDAMMDTVAAALPLSKAS